jgi:hypothetical protein
MLTTGVSVGILAASIDIVADWLGDLKEGFCKPTFYLNRGFCCWGISEQEYCSDWHTWATAMNISSHAGGYIVSYIMFIILAVPPYHIPFLLIDGICRGGKFISRRIRTICKTQRNTRN